MASNAPNTKERPLSFMEKLSPEVFVYRPSEAATTNGSAVHPKLIIVASWTDGRDAHIAKYIVKYQALYPAAQIMLIKSTTSLLLRPQLIAKAVQPAIPVIKAAVTTGSQQSSSAHPEMLIHILSNGGSSSISNLYDAYAASASEGEITTLPRHITIFDSSPCIYRFSGSVAFFSHGLSSLQATLATPLIYLVSFAWSSMITVGMMTDWLAYWGKTHNDPKRNAELRRTYIYSKSDTLVEDRDVEAHAQEAKSNGFEVRLEKFEESAHVSHARKDENRYWEIVRSTWEGN